MTSICALYLVFINPRDHLALGNQGSFLEFWDEFSPSQSISCLLSSWYASFIKLSIGLGTMSYRKLCLKFLFWRLIVWPPANLSLLSYERLYWCWKVKCLWVRPGKPRTLEGWGHNKKPIPWSPKSSLRLLSSSQKERKFRWKSWIALENQCFILIPLSQVSWHRFLYNEKCLRGGITDIWLWRLAMLRGR